MLLTTPGSPPPCAACARARQLRRAGRRALAAAPVVTRRLPPALGHAGWQSRRLARASAADTDLLSVAEEPADKVLGEVVYTLLAARASHVPAAVVLPKFHDSLSPRAYMSVIIALSRKEAWETAAEVAVWVRQQGMELPTLAYVCIAQRRLQEGHWDRALEVYAWMKDLGCTPSGESVELLAMLAARAGQSPEESARVRDLVSWVRVSEAGRALWDIFVSHTARARLANDPLKPAWSSHGLAVEDADTLLHGPLEDLREALRDVMEPVKYSVPPVEPVEVPARAVDSQQPQGIALPDIDSLLRSRRQTP